MLGTPITIITDVHDPSGKATAYSVLEVCNSAKPNTVYFYLT